MANKNAKNVVNAPDVHVVTPSNMGKGLIWTDATKTYDVNVGPTSGLVMNENGEVGVKLSPDAGNLLELRSNGIGYWQVIEESLQRQYVDSVGGSDDNPGTKAQPLKTFEHALRRLANSKNGGRGDATILLKNGGTYYIGKSRFNLNALNLTVINYDDGNDGDVHLGNGVYVYSTTSFIKPKLIAQWAEYPYATVAGNQNGTMTTCLTLRRFVGEGLNLVLEDGALTFPGGTSHFALLERDMILRGCVVDVFNGIFVRTTQLNADNTTINVGPNAVLSDPYNNVYFQFGGNHAGTQVNVLGTTWTLQPSNLRSIPVNKFGLVYDAATKRQFGWSANYDVFA